MRRLFFFIGLIATYYFLAEHGYLERIPALITDFSMENLIESVKELISDVANILKEFIEDLKDRVQK